MITIHPCILPSSQSAIKAESTSSLSANGSINFPKLVIRLYFLAILPSNISVSDAARKIAKAIQLFAPPPKLQYKKNKKGGIIHILNMVNLLGRFIKSLPSFDYIADKIVFRGTGHFYFNKSAGHHIP